MMKKILKVLSILFGLFFVNAGLNKFFNYMPVPENMPQDTVDLMTNLMEIGWLLPLVAVVEIIGGLLFITNRFRALGAVMIFPIMVGIMMTHLFDAREGLPLAFIFFIINIWVLVDNRAKYSPMFS